MSIPPYLTSGASSRAHHALIAALNETKSVQEEDGIVEREIRRAKEVLISRGGTVRLPAFVPQKVDPYPYARVDLTVLGCVIS
jgi:hypothetical protein